MISAMDPEPQAATIGGLLHDERVRAGLTLEQLASQAAALNNLGVLYFLAGQKSADSDQYRKSYVLASNYFRQAKNLLDTSERTEPTECYICLHRTTEANLKQCLLELK